MVNSNMEIESYPSVYLDYITVRGCIAAELSDIHTSTKQVYHFIVVFTDTRFYSMGSKVYVN